MVRDEIGGGGERERGRRGERERELGGESAEEVRYGVGVWCEWVGGEV